MTRRLIPDPVSAANAVFVVQDTEKDGGILVFIHATLTTSADVGDRDVNLIITDKSGNIVCEFAAIAQQAQSTDFEYTWGGSDTPYIGSSNDKVHIPMNSVPLEGGDEIRLSQVGGNGDDQWSDFYITTIGGPGSGLG